MKLVNCIGTLVALAALTGCVSTGEFKTRPVHLVEAATQVPAVTLPVYFDEPNGKFHSIYINSSNDDLKVRVTRNSNERVKIKAVLVGGSEAQIRSYMTYTTQAIKEGALHINIGADTFRCSMSHVGKDGFVDGVCFESVQISLSDSASSTDVYINGRLVSLSY